MATSVTVLVAEISNIRPHPNADKLELCDVNGWQLAIGKGKYKNGDKIVYVPDESIVPAEWAVKWNIQQYLKGANNDRVGKIKLRGEASFGLPVDIPEGVNWEVGENVAEYFGITKYEPPIKTTCGDADKENSLVQRYTDIDNLRHYPKVFEDGEEVIVTEKCHGTNSRVGMIDGVEVAASMSFPRKRPCKLVNDTLVPCDLDSPEVKGNTYWFPWSIPEVRNLIYGIYEETKAKQILLYGEVFGNSIQKGHSYGHVSDIAFLAFDLLINGKYLNYDEFRAYCDKYNVGVCPIIYRGPYDINKIKEISGGKSVLDNATVREGVVVQPVIERQHPKVGRLKMKYVSDDYLFGKKDDCKDV
jgi:RNA ligase (TIGR02306 family)